MDNLQSIIDLDKCNSNKSMSYDIGYPLYATLDIENSNENGLICCRGYDSCSNADLIRSNLGNILCLGYASCEYVAVIWVSSSQSTTLTTNIDQLHGNIYCAGRES